MTEDNLAGRFLLLWRGENALDWEIGVWKQIQSSGAFGAAEAYLEAITRDEWDRQHEKLTAEGWQLSSTGSGGMSRVSVYIRNK